MLRASLLAVLVIGAFALSRLIKGRQHPRKPSTRDEQALVRELVATSRSSSANIALLGDKRFLFHPSNRAFLMYRPQGDSWIALGDPVGEPERFEELLWSFREACDAANARCVFYEVSNNYLPLYIDLGLSFLKLGEEALVDLESFSLEGSRNAEFRQAVNRGKREGAEFAVVPAADIDPMMDELAAVSANWLKSKGAQEKGFSLGRFDRDYIRHFDCAAVRVDGVLVAFANLWKSGDGRELSVDLMRYTDAAPKGVMDYLFTQIMLWGKEQGFAAFNLGMAPLSGLETNALAPAWHKFGNLVYNFGEHFYNFEGLRNYKQKFSPHWEPRFLACRGGLQTPVVLLDVTVLIGGGVRRMIFR